MKVYAIGWQMTGTFLQVLLDTSSIHHHLPCGREVELLESGKFTWSSTPSLHLFRNVKDTRLLLIKLKLKIKSDFANVVFLFLEKKTGVLFYFYTPAQWGWKSNGKNWSFILAMSMISLVLTAWCWLGSLLSELNVVLPRVCLVYPPLSPLLMPLCRC